MRSEVAAENVGDLFYGTQCIYVAEFSHTFVLFLKLIN